MNYWRHRLVARTSGSHPGNGSPILPGATNKKYPALIAGYFCLSSERRESDGSRSDGQ